MSQACARPGPPSEGAVVRGCFGRARPCRRRRGHRRLEPAAPSRGARRRPGVIAMLAIPSHCAVVPSTSWERLHPGRSHSRLSWSTGSAASAGRSGGPAPAASGAPAARSPSAVRTRSTAARVVSAVRCLASAPVAGNRRTALRRRPCRSHVPKAPGPRRDAVRRHVGDLQGQADGAGGVVVRPAQGEHRAVRPQDHGGLGAPRLTGEELVQGLVRSRQRHQAAAGGVGSPLAAVEPVARADAAPAGPVSARRRCRRPRPPRAAAAVGGATTGASYRRRSARPPGPPRSRGRPPAPPRRGGASHDPVGLVARAVGLAERHGRDTGVAVLVAVVGVVGHGSSRR